MQQQEPRAYQRPLDVLSRTKEAFACCPQRGQLGQRFLVQAGLLHASCISHQHLVSASLFVESDHALLVAQLACKQLASRG